MILKNTGQQPVFIYRDDGSARGKLLAVVAPGDEIDTSRLRDATAVNDEDCRSVADGLVRHVLETPGELARLMAVEIPVTPEMVAAAYTLDKALPSPLPNETDYFTAIYRAMAALAPVDLATPGEVSAIRERDEALAERDDALAERDEALLRLLRVPEGGVSVTYHLGQIDALCDTIEVLRGHIAARDARIAELDSLLAAHPAPIPGDPTPNPFREFAGDRRRMGK